MHAALSQARPGTFPRRWIYFLCALTLLSFRAEASVFLSREGTRGAVASESKICSRIGIDLIRRGGNAADAMVGTTLCVGVIGMYHSGIGGGGFMLVRSAKGEYEAIDFRETAPAAAYEDMYENNTIASILGGLASAVPGELRGLEYMHKKYGKLPWFTVCMPAVRVADRGFPVTEDLVNAMTATITPENNFLVTDPNWSQDFAPNGTLLGLGDIMTRKRYAATLHTIALSGASAFYSGAIAASTIDTVQAAGGIMTLSDLAGYNVSLRAPVSISYRGSTMYSTPAPSSGAVTLKVFKTIEGYNMSSPSLRTLNTHRLVEALKFSYAAHAALGDPAFVSNISAFEAAMLSPSVAASVRAQISDEHTLPMSSYNPDNLPIPTHHGTSHLTTADADGLTLSLTTTINLLFGAQLLVPSTGVLMNNEMNDFAIPPSNAFHYPPSPHNRIRAFARPLSSITPVIVERPDGGLLAAGAAGGSRIISATVQVLWHVLDHGVGVREAMRERRLHDQLVPRGVWVEEGFGGEVVRGLRDRGHEVVWVGGVVGAVQAVGRGGKGRFEAGGEPRQGGSGGLVV